ncbi:unnamed protein product [Caenorhabditis brenneri]
MLPLKIIMFTIIIVLFELSMCDDFGIDVTPGPEPPAEHWGYYDDFVKDINEFRAKFAKEYNIPDMYKLYWSEELVKHEMKWTPNGEHDISETCRPVLMDSYKGTVDRIAKDVERLKEYLKSESIRYNQDYFDLKTGDNYDNLEFLNPFQKFLGCHPTTYDFRNLVLNIRHWHLVCCLGPSYSINFWHPKPVGGAATQCQPRFKAENGLCVPVDPSEHTFWGTKEFFLEDLNYMRRKYSKELGIPNMHHVTWNETLVEILKPLNMTREYHFASNNSDWIGYQNSWSITYIPTYASVANAIEEAVNRYLIMHAIRRNFYITRKKRVLDSPVELIHPLQTQIGCMVKEHSNFEYNETVVFCLLGNEGQWPPGWTSLPEENQFRRVPDFKYDVNSTKIPGSECMDGYVNDDGLCVVAPPPTSAPKPVPNVPKKPEAPIEETMESEQENSEASTVEYVVGIYIWYYFIVFIL